MEELVDEILDKTGKLKERFDELTKLVSDPSIIADNREWKKLVKERSALEDVANAHDRLLKLTNDLKSCEDEHSKETDHELKQMFYDEIVSLREQIEKEIEEVKILLLPKDQNDDSNVIIEIRQAAVGRSLGFFAQNFIVCIACMLKANIGKLK